ncbi:dienelactone hydrolase family protein [Paenarthrobacter sp. NPDC089675]|uniref:dienelactone hydrolase family protein n=1 Tax=Paenarthrobacter sp. NPDC089675 TaxID=3364376 RepID=UPI003807F1F9
MFPKTAQAIADLAGIQRRPSAIAGYEDWPDYSTQHRHLAGSPEADRLAETLGVPAVVPNLRYRVEAEAEDNNVVTSRLSWQTGFGPRTSAWLVRPANASGPLPGILALHCHGGIKSHGAERLLGLPLGAAEHSMHDGGTASRPALGPVPPGLREKLYGSRPPATWLAQQGFAVLAHDAFMWGSRRFNLDSPPHRTAHALAGQEALWREAGVVPSAAERYDAAAAAHEETVAKAATLLGSTVAGTVAHDDLAALGVLASVPEVDAGRMGCIGFSGGGGRAMLLAALSPQVRSLVVTCMMTTFQSLLPAYTDAHSWLLHSPGLSKLGEWPGILARSSAEAFLVQYGLRDELFPEAGMRDADAYLEASAPSRYTGSFHDEKHCFSPAMQAEAATFLASHLTTEQTTPASTRTAS